MAGSAELLPGILDRLRLFVLRARVELVPAEDLIVLGLADLPASCSANNAWSTASGLSYGFSKRAGGSGDAAAADADGAAEWKVRELQHGVAWLGPRTRERFIPQMLGFDRLGAVSFSKGCYPGQEVIARAKYLGKVKRGPLRLVLETPDGADVAVTERVEAGAGVMLIAAQQRLEATLIDHAPLAENAQTLLLVVAPQAEDAVGSIEIGDRAYRCATI
jgi:folate-binding protein YgfZ